MENIVFLELLRRGYRVSIGKIDGKERELAPLREIEDNYEKVVLSMDRSFVKSYEGISYEEHSGHPFGGLTANH